MNSVSGRKKADFPGSIPPHPLIIHRPAPNTQTAPPCWPIQARRHAPSHHVPFTAVSRLLRSRNGRLPPHCFDTRLTFTSRPRERSSEESEAAERAKQTPPATRPLLNCNQQQQPKGQEFTSPLKE